MKDAAVSPAPAGSTSPRFVYDLGVLGVDLFVSGRELALVFVRTLYFLVRGRRDRGAVVRQMHAIGVESLFFVSITMGFIGMIFVYQSGVQVRRILPDFSQLGATYLELLVRDLAASVGALILATRVGAGIAAEIGSMVVTEQIEALRSMGIEPARYLVVPRLLALLLMLPLLTIFADVISIVGGGWIAQTYAHISVDTFIASVRQTIGISDVLKGLVKTFVFAIIIAMIGAYQGLTTKGGAAGVGVSTTGAVVLAIIMIFISNFTLSFLLFGG